jgi:hypothetical protein
VSRRTFFETGYGSLAVLPSVTTRTNANKAGIFLLLKPSSLNLVKRKQMHLWFQFDHYLPESDGKPTHVGVFVIKILRSNIQSHLVTIYRNPNWERPGNDTKLGKLDLHLEMPWSTFTNDLQRWAVSTNVSISDRDIRGQWHAMPTNNTAFSWEYRTFWPKAVTKFKETQFSVTGRQFDSENVSVNTQLLRFTPTKTPGSSYPVTFEVVDDDAEALFIALYSPDSGEGTDEYSRWFWVRFAE